MPLEFTCREFSMDVIGICGGVGAPTRCKRLLSWGPIPGTLWQSANKSAALPWDACATGHSWHPLGEYNKVKCDACATANPSNACHISWLSAHCNETHRTSLQAMSMESIESRESPRAQALVPEAHRSAASASTFSAISKSIPL